jgi:hypothetical protein
MMLSMTKINPLLCKEQRLFDFPFAFSKLANASGINEDDQKILLGHIPWLHHQLAFIDSLSGKWRYEFGNSMNNPTIIGSNTFSLMETLVTALRETNARMSRLDFERWVQYLSDETSHQNRLEEAAPLCCLSDGIGVFPNVKRSSEKNTTDVDWELLIPHFPEFLLEVKHRNFDIKDHLQNVANSPLNMPEPRHDTNLLFKNIEKKFDPVKPETKLQGVWVSTVLKQPLEKLRASFDSVDERKVHFALLVQPGAKKDSAFLLIRPGLPGQEILNIFNLKHDSDMVF